MDYEISMSTGIWSQAFTKVTSSKKLLNEYFLVKDMKFQAMLNEDHYIISSIKV